MGAGSVVASGLLNGVLAGARAVVVGGGIRSHVRCDCSDIDPSIEPSIRGSLACHHWIMSRGSVAFSARSPTSGSPRPLAWWARVLCTIDRSLSPASIACGPVDCMATTRSGRRSCTFDVAAAMGFNRCPGAAPSPRPRPRSPPSSPPIYQFSRSLSTS